MSPAGKRNGNQERARQLAEQGMTAAQIAKQLGVKYNTAYYYLHPEKCSRTKKKKPAPAEEDTDIRAPGWNKDRHACRDFRYKSGGHKGCDYYVLTDHERGCDPADCDKYEKGVRAGKNGQTGT